MAACKVLKRVDKAIFSWSQPAAVPLRKAGWSHMCSTNMRCLGHISMHMTSPTGIKHEGSEQGSLGSKFGDHGHGFAERAATTSLSNSSC